MAISYERITSSGSFQFIIGPERKRFTIHKELVSYLSPRLDQLMTERLSKGTVELLDVDDQTFVRFCQFAYTGDYTSALHETVPDESATEGGQSPTRQPPEPAVDDGPIVSPIKSAFGDFPIPKKKAKQRKAGPPMRYANHELLTTDPVSEPPPAPAPPPLEPEPLTELKTEPEPKATRKEALWTEFQNKQYPVPQPAMAATAFVPRRNVDESEDYTPIFLCHERAYVFGARFDIPSLRNLALHKLHKTLGVFHIYPKRRADIVSLITYGYDEHGRDAKVAAVQSNGQINGPGHSHGQGQDFDGLRKLIVKYVACVFEQVGTDAAFLDVMEKGGPFARDLVVSLMKRIE